MRPPSSLPRRGQPAPDFRTRNQHGELVDLESLSGAPALIVFFPWAFTGICTGELTELQDHLAEIRASGVRVLAVSTDTMFTLRVFAEQAQLDFELLSDHWPHGAIASAYGVFDAELGCALRGSFLLDEAGRVVWEVVHHIAQGREISAVLAALGTQRR